MAQVPVVEANYIGDGVTRVFSLTWVYLNPSEVFVSVNGVNVPFAWLAGSSSTIQTVEAPAAGARVRVYRSTRAFTPLHEFSAGVPFLPRYVDENAKQLLYALQEGVQDFQGVVDDVTAIAGRSLRVPPNEAVIPALPAAAERAGKLLAFDVAGLPTMLSAATDSAAQLALDLLNKDKGAAMVRLPSGQLVSSLSPLLDTGPNAGAALIPNGTPFVNSVAALRTVKRTNASTTVMVTSYYGDGLTGGGLYLLDFADTTTADNGGTVIVAADGGRWRLVWRATAQTFGARGNNSANDYPAIAAYVAWVQSKGGGEVHIPAGKYKLNSSLLLSPTSSGWHNLVIRGDGAGSTVLDFADAPAGSDGIGVLGWGGRFILRGLHIKNAPAVGLNINKGEVRGGPSQISRFTLQDLIVDNSGSDGIRMLQTYMGTCTDIESRSNGARGIALLGFHTSMNFIRVWAGGDAARPNGGNAGSGWFVNGVVYSNFIGCSGDFNGGPGWQVKNVAGVLLSDCGSESNGQEGILLQTTNTDADGLPSVSTNIRGLLIDGFFAYNNSKQQVNGFANFLGAVTANGRDMELSMRGINDLNENGSTLSMVLAGTSGFIRTHESMVNLSGTVTRTGVTDRQNNSIAGRSTMVQLGADQAIPNATDTAVAFTVVSTNRLIATLSGSVIVIPAGVNRIRITAGIFWGNSTVGSRYIRVVKVGAGFVGSPQLKSPGVGFTPQSITSAVIDVTPGDNIGITAFQDSGGPLSIVNNGSTFLSVEAVG